MMTTLKTSLLEVVKEKCITPFHPRGAPWMLWWSSCSLFPSWQHRTAVVVCLSKVMAPIAGQQGQWYGTAAATHYKLTTWDCCSQTTAARRTELHIKHCSNEFSKQAVLIIGPSRTVSQMLHHPTATVFISTLSYTVALVWLSVYLFCVGTVEKAADSQLWKQLMPSWDKKLGIEIQQVQSSILPTSSVRRLPYISTASQSTWLLSKVYGGLKGHFQAKTIDDLTSG